MEFPPTPRTAGPSAGPPTLGQDQKFCMDCGKVILRRAEICPGCGCRQINPSQATALPFALPSAPGLQGQLAGQMALLLVLNFLWNGLGNLAIGDKRGWQYGFINWIVVAIACFTFWVPALLFFAYCGYAGYQWLLEKENNKQIT